MKQLILLLLLPMALPAQDITGIWTGFIYSGENKLPYEVVISGEKEKLTGFALIIFTIDGVENIGVKSLKLKEKKGKFYVEDDLLVYNNYTTTAKRVKLSCVLQLHEKNSLPELSGSFTTKSVDMRQIGRQSYSGTIELQKRSNGEQAKIIGVLHELDLLGTLSFLPSTAKEKTPAVNVKTPGPVTSQRIEKTSEVVMAPAAVKNLPPTTVAKKETVIIREIFFRSDSLELSLYDNGEIDGDTVSVIMNGKLLMNKIRLTAAGIRQTIFLTPDIGDSILLVMNAENLGSIPPNTGLLVLKDGAQRYEMRFVGDYQKNSAIILRRKR